MVEDDWKILEKTLAGRTGHPTSWLMFSPNELLRLNLKEAFSRERIPASDQQVQVWDAYRLRTARDQLGILRSGTNKGALPTESLNSLQPSALENPIGWFEDFERWQRELFWSDLCGHALRAEASSDTRLARLGFHIRGIAETGATANSAAPFQELRLLARELGEHWAELRQKAQNALRVALAKHLRVNEKLLDQINEFAMTLDGASEGAQDLDEIEADEDDEEITTPRASREAAFNLYIRAMRAQARALVTGRRLGSRSRDGRIVQWLGARVPEEAEMRRVGDAVVLGGSLRRVANPLRDYLQGMSRRYRRFRRARESEGSWYLQAAHGPSELSPLEIDVVMLAILRAGRMLLRERRISAALDEPALSSLRGVRDLFRTQVLVDEATDFSVIQLACMAALCDPAANSFLACGDFNQRVTEWGCRSSSDLRWIFDDIDIRTVNVTYRHSRQLNVLAHRLAGLSGQAHEAALPDHVNNEGPAPVFGFALSGTALIAWLKDRIIEIEQLTTMLPSVAVLVHREQDVQPIADGLNAALSAHSRRCTACPRGQVRGNDDDVRVFDVQHIKGLEFEAVFFVGVDELAAAKPQLFDKFLYVGATRAAMYLGLSTTGPDAPEYLAPTLDLFGQNWR